MPHTPPSPPFWREPKNLRVVAKGLVLILGLAALAYVLRALGLVELFDTAWMDRSIVNRPFGWFLFLLFCAGFTAVGLPRQLVCVLAGYGFGLVEGTVLSLVGTTLGAMAVYGFARLFGRGISAKANGPKARKLAALLRDSPFSMTLVLRFLPVGSNLLTNVAAGMASINWLWFLTGTFLGHLPQTLVFTLLGSGARVDPTMRTTLSVLLFLASSALGILLYRRYHLEHVVGNGDNEE